ncbi:MAG TPA: ABC transporter substrate-binding protein [Candidatus Binatia bacterium]|jgi:phospholipid transport system substrate-binding protein
MDRLHVGKNLIPYLLALLLVCGSNAVAAGPTETVESTVNQVIKILTDPRYAGETNREERRRLLRETISPRFDFQEMAKRSLGTEWIRRTPEEQKEFVKIFTEFVEQTSVHNIDSYDKQKFLYTGEKTSERDAVVEGKIVTRDGDEIKIDYLLNRTKDEWKVYDLVVNGISFDDNYRAQFARVIRQSSYEGLVQRLKEKLADKAVAVAPR